MTLTVTDDNTYGLDAPTSPDLSPKPTRPTPQAKRIGNAAGAIAAAGVIVVLMFGLGAARGDTQAARADAAAARTELATARVDLADAEAELSTGRTALAAANAKVTAQNQQMAADRVVATRARACIDMQFEVGRVLIGGSYAAGSAAIAQLSGPCAGLGPQLKTIGGGSTI